MIVFVELLFPWVVFAILLIIGDSLKLDVVITIPLALVGSIAAMFFIRWERSARMIRQLKAISKSR